MTEEQKRNWGGERAGAGRPKLSDREARVSATIQIPRKLKERIQKEAKRLKISFSRAAENRLKR